MTNKQLESEIIKALDINSNVDWITTDPNKEFKELKKFVKKLFKEYREEQMITEEQALDEFRQLLNDDPIFAECWNDCDPDFYQWCSNYSDYKHIKRKE